jgi:hypothetical protein
MKKTLANVVIATWILTGGMGRLGMAVAAGSAEGRAHVVVYVRNYAQLDRKTLVRAGAVAKGVLRKTGVEATFIPVAPDEVYREGSTPGGLNFSLKVLSHEMTEKLGLSTTFMGLAPGEEHDRTEAFVFAYKAVELARKQADPGLADILGYAMAHEIGHLFNLSHSPQGIMHGGWDQRDLYNMTMGRLNFSPEQATQIRAELARRTHQAQTVEMASLR